MVFGNDKKKKAKLKKKTETITNGKIIKILHCYEILDEIIHLLYNIKNAKIIRIHLT